MRHTARTTNDESAIAGSNSNEADAFGHIQAEREVGFGWPFAFGEGVMPKGPFLPSEFVPTQFSTAADKANFGNTLLHFLDSDCARHLFTRKFYNRLSMTFGHIAHCDIEGFYSTWFTRDRHRLGFVTKLLRWPCHGDPKFTFSDVEHGIQRAVRNYLARYELRAAEALRAAEISELQRLEAKYRVPPATESATPLPGTMTGETRAVEGAPPPGLIQMSLF